MKYILLTIDKSYRYPSPSSHWTCFDRGKMVCGTLKQAKDFIKEEYSHVKKKHPCYIDTKDGETKRIGTIYCFKEKDDYGKTLYRQDWVSYKGVEGHYV